MNSRKKGALTGLLAALLAFALAALAFVFVPKVLEPKGYPCTDVTNAPAFLAYDKATRGDNFGPASQATTVKQAQADLHQRRCTDAALVTAHAAYYGVDGLSLPMSQKAFETAVQAALDAPETVWRNRVKAVEAYEASGLLSMVESQAQYQTLFFRKGDSNQVIPQYFAGPVKGSSSTLFTVKHGDTVKQLKLECGFQPFTPHFPPGTPKPPHKTPPAECIRADVPKPAGYGAGWEFNWYFCKYLCLKKWVKNPGDSTWTFNWYFCKWLPPGPGPSPSPTPTPTPTPSETPTPPPPPVKCEDQHVTPCPKNPKGVPTPTVSATAATPSPVGTASAPTRPAAPDPAPPGGVHDVNPPTQPANPDSGSGATHTVAPPPAPAPPAPAPPSSTSSGIVGSD